MKDTKIRWAGNTWNPMTGCSKVSPGCTHCYAETIAEKFRGTAFPNGFDPTYKPAKLNDPRRWREPTVVFVNSMSDIHHEAFSRDQVDSVYRTMLDVPRHQYLVLTKRPNRMAKFFLGGTDLLGQHTAGWLERNGLDSVPAHIWLGTTIEDDPYCRRADQLRRIPVPVRFISAEPLLGPLPSLNLDGIAWLIAGGESGPGFRPMPHDWARDLRDRCQAAGVAFYFKQSAAIRTEMGMDLDGRRYEEYPAPYVRALAAA
jgi:protein gp37